MLPASRWPPNGFHVDPYYFVHYRILYVYVVQPKSGGLSSQIHKWDRCPCPHARLRRLWQLVRELSRGVKRLASAPALQPLASDWAPGHFRGLKVLASASIQCPLTVKLGDRRHGHYFVDNEQEFFLSHHIVSSLPTNQQLWIHFRTTPKEQRQNW